LNNFTNKFLAEDLPLFAAIVQDLFPGVEIPSNDYGELQVALEEEIDKTGSNTISSNNESRICRENCFAG
jgi:hypothetical protein